MVSLTPEVVTPSHWTEAANALKQQGRLQIQLPAEVRERVTEVAGGLCGAYRALFGNEPTMTTSEGENGALLVEWVAAANVNPQ